MTKHSTSPTVVDAQAILAAAPVLADAKLQSRAKVFAEAIEILFNTLRAVGSGAPLPDRTRVDEALAMVTSEEVAEVARSIAGNLADIRHDRSCSCGDRVGHEAEDGSDYSIAPE